MGKGRTQQPTPRVALDIVPRIADQRFGIRSRLAQLATTARWQKAGAAAPGSGGVAERLGQIDAAAILRHGTHGYGSPVMLVHAATAPNGVPRTLPVFPLELLWQPSLQAAWAAAVAVTAAYSPAEGRAEPTRIDHDLREVMAYATANRDADAIGSVDTAIDVATNDSGAFAAAAAQAVDLIAND